MVVILVAFYFALLSPLELAKTTDRNFQEYLLSVELKERIHREVSELPYDLSPVDYSMHLTAELLEFSEKNDIENGLANCVGYARLFTSICNYALEVGGYEGRVKHVAGYVTWHGINLCDVATFVLPKEYKNFFKDHDFIELDYDDKYVYIDPSMYDLICRNGYTEVNK